MRFTFANIRSLTVCKKYRVLTAQKIVTTVTNGRMKIPLIIEKGSKRLMIYFDFCALLPFPKAPMHFLTLFFIFPRTSEHHLTDFSDEKFEFCVQ